MIKTPFSLDQETNHMVWKITQERIEAAKKKLPQKEYISEQIHLEHYEITRLRQVILP